MSWWCVRYFIWWRGLALCLSNLALSAGDMGIDPTSSASSFPNLVPVLLLLPSFCLEDRPSRISSYYHPLLDLPRNRGVWVLL